MEHRENNLDKTISAVKIIQEVTLASVAKKLTAMIKQLLNINAHIINHK